MPSVLSADGCVEVDGVPANVDCCPPPLCGTDLCGAFCAFINVLPTGPMWDYWKRKATEFFQSDPDNPESCELTSDLQCPTLVLHAIYVVLKLRDIIHNALWPAYRESDPTTASTTLDSWLERLQWEDCYRQHCRSVLLGDLTPYEIQGPCGPIYCEFPIPPELNEALKRAIVISLTRAQMGVIKNLCGISWIIEPLGAKLQPRLPIQPNPPSSEGCESMCPDDIAFEIVRISDTLPGVLLNGVCETNMPRPQIPAVVSYGCDVPVGLPTEIWPGIIAAECIVRSLMPTTCPNNIFSAC